MRLPSLPKLTEFDKALASLAGLLAQLIELGVLHGTALHYAQTVSGLLAGALVVLAQPPGPKAPVVQVGPLEPPAPPAPPAAA